MNDFDELKEKWNMSWDKALNIWSFYTRLRKPIYVVSDKEKKEYDVDDESIAFIRLTDLQVIISLENIVKLGLSNYSLEILSHEIGHHIYCPADLTDQGRLIARANRGLYNLNYYAPMVVNLYSDLMINERLFRLNNLRLDEVYSKLNINKGDELWLFYMRIYEILWALPAKSLTKCKISGEMEGDAQLGNRIIRSYSDDWLKGVTQFANLCYSYLVNNKNHQSNFKYIFDTKNIAGNMKSVPAGLIEADEDEVNIDGDPADFEKKLAEHQREKKQSGNSGANYRQPFEYGQILKSMGINLSDEEIAMRYYKELAIPYLIPFPKEKSQVSKEPIAEGLENWDISSPIEEINWFETVMRSPYVIPGVTTYSTLYGEDKGKDRDEDPIDLDIYVDSSGSIPNPVHSLSYLTLCGFIIALSALRSGSSVQVTLWSGVNEFYKSEGFIKNEDEILKILVGYFGGGTAFPIHILRDTYEKKDKVNMKIHILVISDEGVTTMFEKDEKGNSGIDVAKMALKNSEAGGTFVLNLYNETILKSDNQFLEAYKMGWDIYPIKDWNELIEFGKDFVKKHYSKESRNGKQ